MIEGWVLTTWNSPHPLWFSSFIWYIFEFALKFLVSAFCSLFLLHVFSLYFTHIYKCIYVCIRVCLFVTHTWLFLHKQDLVFWDVRGHSNGLYFAVWTASHKSYHEASCWSYLYVHILWRHKWLIVVITSVCGTQWRSKMFSPMHVLSFSIDALPHLPSYW